MKKVLQDIIVTYQAISCLLSSSLLLALCLLSSYLPFIPFLFFPSSFFVEPSPLSQLWILNKKEKNICYCMLCLVVSEMEWVLSILYVGQWSWGFCVMFEGLPICCSTHFLLLLLLFFFFFFHCLELLLLSSSSSIVWNSYCCYSIGDLVAALVVVFIQFGAWLQQLLLLVLLL